MEFGKYVGWIRDGKEKRVWFETDRGLSCLVRVNGEDDRLRMTAHQLQWGKFNPYLFEGKWHDGAPDAKTCALVERVFERDKQQFAEDEAELLELHDQIEAWMKRTD